MSGRRAALVCLFGLALADAVFFVGCGRRPRDGQQQGPAASHPPAPVDAAAPASASTERAAGEAATDASPAGAAAAASGSAGGEELRAEEREADPRSETVKIKLFVTPSVDAVVWWGSKKLGPVGKRPLEIERPRASGPVDITIRATGYLPHHTRLFTDRNDRLSVRLLKPNEATGLLGYRRRAVTPDAGLATPPSP